MKRTVTKLVASVLALLCVAVLVQCSSINTAEAHEVTVQANSVVESNLISTQQRIETPTKAELHKVFTINVDTLSSYAWVNEKQCTMPVKEVAIDIQGLNSGHGYKTVPELQDTMLGERGVLVVRPYSGPWNWMSFETIKTIDKVLDAVYEKYGLDDSIPLVAFGRSMGGMGALNYARYGAHKLTAVALNSPVTNLAYHCTERPDCAATIYRAYNYYNCSVEEAVMQHDPMNFINDLPRIPYFIAAGDADLAVHKNVHSDVYVSLMREKGYHVTYLEVPGMTHVDLAGHPQALAQYANFISSFAK